MKRTTIKDSKVIMLFVVLLFILLIARLLVLSLSKTIDNVNLKEFANNRNTKSEIIYAKRGNIYDKDGDALASTTNSYKLIAYLDSKRTTNINKPEHVIDKEQTAKKLSDLLPITYEYALERLSITGAYQVEFGIGGSNISESDKNKIEALELPGIDFISGIKRHYSMGSFASYIIGYAKTKEDGSIVGELGIESYYNDYLSGTNGESTFQTDAYGYTLPSAEVVTKDAIDGNDIYLTIDTNIQMFAEDVTKELSENYTMDWMIFTVMDASTGAIVASSTSPNFNPNDLSTIKNYMNPLVSYEYEPGSTMKTFSFATAIEEGVYNGSSTYDSGSIKVGDVVINDFNKTGWGRITYDTGYAYSSNVAAVNLSKKIGETKLKEYYRNLGFGSKTGIELANETKGNINFKYESGLATASFGQGITVTPIQMLQAMSSLTNDGVTIKPYIVDKIVDNKGTIIYEGKRTELNKVYSKETVNYMRKLMHDVVYDGTSKYWRGSKTTIIGKTGTAQIASKKGGYLEGTYDYVRSFAGIFPEENPKYIFYVAASRLSSGSAKPIGNAVTKAIDKIVSYLGIENVSDNEKQRIIKLDNYLSKELSSTKEELKKNGLDVISIGSGKYIINQYPLKNTSVLEGSKVFLVSNNTDYKMENIIGWSLNEVQNYANILGVELKISGYGYVTNQNILPGSEIIKGNILEITLSK